VERDRCRGVEDGCGNTSGRRRAGIRSQPRVRGQSADDLKVAAPDWRRIRMSALWTPHVGGTLVGMKPVVIRPLALGTIHCRVGLLGQRFEACSVPWIQANADTCSNRDLVPVEGKGI